MTSTNLAIVACCTFDFAEHGVFVGPCGPAVVLTPAICVAQAYRWQFFVGWEATAGLSNLTWDEKTHHMAMFMGKGSFTDPNLGLPHLQTKPHPVVYVV